MSGDGGDDRSTLLPSPASEDADFVEGRALFNDDNCLAALRHFERAYLRDPDNAAHASYYAMVLAIERGQVKNALDTCKEALDRARHQPDLFMNLARVQLRANEKLAAIDTLRDGMRTHPNDEELQGALVKLGIRKKPPLPFLKRSHWLNKWLGIFLARLGLR